MVEVELTRKEVDEMIAAVSVLVKMGYKVTLEAQPIGKVGTGIHLHVTDEEVED